MKEMHERVAELEQRLTRLEAIVGDPDSAGNGGAKAYYDDVLSWPSGIPDAPPPSSVTSGGTVYGSSWAPPQRPVDNEWTQPVAFSS